MINPMKLFRKPTLEQIKTMRFQPGHKVPISGQYTDGHGEQVTMVKGRRFPPTNSVWKLTDHTR